MTVRSEGMRARRAIAIAVLTFAASAAAAKERVVQLAEDSAVRHRVENVAVTPLRAAPPTRVCEPGAKWIRLGFKELVLDGYDSLVLTSSEGDSYTFEGKHWNDRAFHARALRGECVDIYPYFGDRDSRYAIDGYETGTKPLAESTVVVAGAGDICDSSGNACAGTSDLIVNINPTAVFTAGDNAYSNGTLAEYNNRYAPTWGRFKALTSPSPGNHDYNTTNASGYFDYFNGVGVQTGPAGDRSKGYYSWDVGDWHFVSLNTMSGGTVATAQVNWLKADLAANTKPCTAAYFHHPLVSRGNYSGYSQVKPFWDALYAAKADLVLVGHDHNYQRYGKMNPSQAAASNGIRQVLVGTGGRAFYGLSGTHPLLEKANANTWGVLKLTLTATGYTGEFVPRAGGTFTDTFSGTCNKGAPATNQPPTANFTSATNALTATFTDTSTDSDGTIAARAWTFGDGGTSTATNPSRTYATAGTYNVTLTITDDDGATHATTRAVTVATSAVQTYTNTTDYAINDNATVDSPITVSGRSGNAPTNASVTIAIVHTYIGDLKVDLVAPDGSLYNLHSRTGSSTDNINKTVTLNLSSEALNGSWKLRVNDNAAQDTGRIDSWSITF